MRSRLVNLARMTGGAVIATVVVFYALVVFAVYPSYRAYSVVMLVVAAAVIAYTVHDVTKHWGREPQ